MPLSPAPGPPVSWMLTGALVPAAMFTGLPRSSVMPGGSAPEGWSAASACQCTPVAPVPLLAVTLSCAVLVHTPELYRLHIEKTSDANEYIEKPSGNIIQEVIPPLVE